MAEKSAKDAKNNGIIKGTLTGRAYFPFLSRPQKDQENDREEYKVDLILTDDKGNPIIVKDKKTGQSINMLERAKELQLVIKEETKSVPGTYVRIKRVVRIKDDGTKTQAPEVKDKDGSDLSKVNVGNESLVKVEFSAIPILKGVAKGKNTAYLNKVVVYNLVPWVGKMDEEEFEFPTAMTQSAAVKNANTNADEEISMEIED